MLNQVVVCFLLYLLLRRSLARQQQGSPSCVISRWLDQQDLLGARTTLQ